MPRPKKTEPSLRCHISGQAVVTFNQKNFYLGPYDSPESIARYHSLVAQYIRSGGETPCMEEHQADTPITVSVVTGEARAWFKTKYANDLHRMRAMFSLCDVLDDEYGDTPADKFGPRKLSNLRDLFIASGNCRKYTNQRIRGVINIFRHAVSRELIEISVPMALETLEPLRQGQTTARESDPVEPVDIEVVRATAKHLSPPVRAMVALQVATGMRPSELCAMKPRHIDRSGVVWIYRLGKHKTSRHGIKKAVPIVGEARKALEPFLNRDPNDYCFKPAESEKWHRQQRTLNRKTPPSCGNRVGSTKSSKPRTFKECFDKDVYRRAIERAAKKAKVDHWFPYQLRHMAATEVRDALGIEAASALLGHSRTDMSEHYAKIKEAKAIEAAKVAPQLVF